MDSQIFTVENDGIYKADFTDNGYYRELIIPKEKFIEAFVKYCTTKEGNNIFITTNLAEKES